MGRFGFVAMQCVVFVVIASRVVFVRGGKWRYVCPYCCDVEFIVYQYL